MFPRMKMNSLSSTQSGSKTKFFSKINTGGINTQVRYATFEAWAYIADYPAPLDNLPRTFDHTYVVCPNEGVRWKCHGGNQGGRLIASGGGNYKIASCIADGSGDGAEAGIAYGVNGVCHQIANRILWSSGSTVITARGAAVSSAIYGTYGEDASMGAEWVTRRLKCDPPIHIPPIHWSPNIPSPFSFNLISYPEIDFSNKEFMSSNDNKNIGKFSYDKEYQEYIVRMMALYAQKNIEHVKLIGADLEITLRYLLKEKITSEEIKEIIKSQRGLLEEHQKNKGYLLENNNEAMNSMSESIRGTFENFSRILGESRYGDVFNTEPEHAKFVINPNYYNLFYRQHNVVTLRP